MRQRGGSILGGTITSAGRSDAAFGDQSTMGKCCLGYVIELMSSSIGAPCHIIHWASEDSRKLVKSSLGKEEFAFNEMAGHVSMLREFYAHFVALSPGMVANEDCESLPTHLKNERAITEEFLFPRLLAVPQALETQDLETQDLDLGNPGGGLTKTKGCAAPPLRLLESGTYNPGTLRPIKGVASRGN